jgi:mannitol-1-/sugar-/sorbitol-6-phosphatase
MRFEADALLFDMDGTLIDSTAAVLRSWAAVVAEFAIPAEVFAAVPTHGRPSAEILADLVPPELIGPAAARLDVLELTDTGDLVVLPGAAELTAAAPPGRWAVVTSANRELARVRLVAGRIPMPPQLVTIDDVSRGKPDPEPFLLAAKLLGVDPERCLAFEDAPAGLAAARAAGARTVAVTTTHARSELDADLVVPDLSALRIEAAVGGGPVTVSCTESYTGPGGAEFERR